MKNNEALRVIQKHKEPNNDQEAPTSLHSLEHALCGFRKSILLSEGVLYAKNHALNTTESKDWNELPKLME